jgi:hypothetical protein
MPYQGRERTIWDVQNASASDAVMQSQEMATTLETLLPETGSSEPSIAGPLLQSQRRMGRVATMQALAQSYYQSSGDMR